MDIVTFLTARLDEVQADAEAAQQADPGPWTVDPTLAASTNERSGLGAGLVVAADDVALWDCEGSNTLCMTAPTSIHVARWDPTYVLREVAAKRAVISRTLDYMEKIDSEWGCCHSAESIAAGRCEDELPENEEIFRALAAIDADHPDYNPAWALPLER